MGPRDAVGEALPSAHLEFGRLQVPTGSGLEREMGGIPRKSWGRGPEAGGAGRSHVSWPPVSTGLLPSALAQDSCGTSRGLVGWVSVELIEPTGWKSVGSQGTSELGRGTERPRR